MPTSIADSGPGTLRQAQVGQHHRGPPLLKGLHRLWLVARLDDGVALAFDGQPQHRAEGVFVFD